MISLERSRWYLNYHELHGGFSVFSWQAKYLNNREEMNQALTNFTDAHNSLIQNKDDYMNNQKLGPISHIIPRKILENT